MTRGADMDDCSDESARRKSCTGTMLYRDAPKQEAAMVAEKRCPDRRSRPS